MQKIKENMTTNLVTVNACDPLSDAYTVMYMKNIRHLPVCDEGGAIIGIISDRDLARAMNSEIIRKGDSRTEKLSFAANLKVRDYMNWPLRAIDKRSSLKVAAKMMVEEKISALLVTSSAEIVGIITSEDMLNALIGLLDDTEYGINLNLEDLMSRSAIGEFARYASDVGV